MLYRWDFTMDFNFDLYAVKHEWQDITNPNPDTGRYMYLGAGQMLQ